MTTIDRLNALPNPFAGVHLPAKRTRETRYNAAAVDKAIAASNRAGQRVSRKEARLIHAVLKGR